MGKKDCPKCGGEMTELSLLRFRGPPSSPTLEKSPPIGHKCKKCGHFVGNALVVEKRAMPDNQGRVSLLDVHEEECPMGGKHKLKTEFDVAWCEKCDNRWCLR